MKQLLCPEYFADIVLWNQDFANKNRGDTAEILDFSILSP